jgi:tetratricopeptide (TPR) repeat protein
MNCAQVKNEDFSARYLLGELSEGEQVAFEEHFFECERCFEELETLRAVQAELVESEDAVQAQVPTRGPRRIWFIAAGVAAALVAIGVAVQLFTPATTLPPELLELARIEAPSYEAVRLRGAADEAQQRFRSAMESYSEGDYVSAIPGLEEAAKLDPTAPNISFFLGACYLLTGRDPDGINTLQHTVALGDTVFLEEAHLLLAKVYIHRGEFDVARIELESVIDLGGDFESEARALLAELSREVPAVK